MIVQSESSGIIQPSIVDSISVLSNGVLPCFGVQWLEYEAVLEMSSSVAYDVHKKKSCWLHGCPRFSLQTGKLSERVK